MAQNIGLGEVVEAHRLEWSQNGPGFTVTRMTQYYWREEDAKRDSGLQRGWPARTMLMRLSDGRYVDLGPAVSIAGPGASGE